MYVFSGIWLCVYFLLDPGVRIILSGSWILDHEEFCSLHLVFVIALVMVLGSLVLALFGLVLVVRGGVWVARVSGVLCFFLLFCYFVVMLLSIFVI